MISQFLIPGLSSNFQIPLSFWFYQYAPVIDYSFVYISWMDVCDSVSSLFLVHHVLVLIYRLELVTIFIIIILYIVFFH